MNKLTTSVPIYSVNADAYNQTFVISVPLWFAMVIAIIVLTNILLWGFIGVLEAVRFIIL